VFMLFLLPAVSMLAGYATYFKRINKQPTPCVDCDNPPASFTQYTKESILETLNKIDAYRQQLSAEDELPNFGGNTPLYRQQTETDLAFLNEKIKSMYAQYFSDEAKSRQQVPLKVEETIPSQPGEVVAGLDTQTVTVANRRQITKEINDFVFGENKNPITNILVNEKTTPRGTPSAKAPSTSPAINPTPANPPPPINTAPNSSEFIVASIDKSTNEGDKSTDCLNINGCNNTDIGTGPNKDDVTIDTGSGNGEVDGVQAVPLSPTQYFMIMGLGTLLLLRHRKQAVMR